MPALSALISPRLTTFLLGAGALAFVVSIIVFPDQAFRSSLQGLQLWWKLVFPALLPFLILTELLRGLGLLHGIGVLLEPLFRVVLRIPGIGGFIMAIGFTAGMPAGAAAVGTLRKNGQLTRDEGERLLAASHLLSPVILISVVGVGFLHSAAAGLALAVIHYGSALLLALFHRMRLPSDAETTSYPRDNTGYIRRFFITLEDARARDGRTFGKLLGDAVSSGVQQLFVIGGCMMMFSVLLQAVSLTGATQAIASALQPAGAGKLLQDPGAFLSAAVAGLLEPHLGAFAISQQLNNGASGAVWGYAALSALLAWGGLSSHAQVSSFTAATDLRFSRFMLARLQHGVIAYLVTLVVWHPLYAYFGRDATVSAWAPSLSQHNGWLLEQDRWWPFISPMMLQFGSTLLVMLVLSVFAAFLFHRGRKPFK
ncbi:sporulation integral membrane protein YlbJ [Paenibacillus sp. UNCCL117]|uniref:nucleoside recognition domain-containing protein n=1 Tax=unclassified Paenibacillus TaxID=185978 RepID=UPI00088F5538|nr:MULTISPECIES: nucleoside recognition domain-containing protein [unclassified Paenibacillus]SDD95972.1 sporulation integral membrane protein YlbJ [Paenibacillus sp. cl123]SFW56493.1 sporulation integral membrane protein YlbJ [Paenibacillus sp. UNCCL117]